MTNNIRQLIATVMLVSAWSADGNAASSAALYIAQEQSNAGCDGQPGAFTKMWETDLTGDGKKDLILDHANLRCAGGAGSNACGASGACEILVYVRKGKLLVETPLPENTVTVNKLPGGRLSLLIGPLAKARAKTVRWNGSMFK